MNLGAISGEICLIQCHMAAVRQELTGLMGRLERLETRLESIRESLKQEKRERTGKEAGK